MALRTKYAAGLASLLAAAPTTARADDAVTQTSETAPVSVPEPQPAPLPVTPQSYAPTPPGEEQPRVLFPGRVKHGGYGGPELKLTSMVGDPALLVGVQGGWVINHALVIGAAGYGLVTQHDAPAAVSPAFTSSTLQLGYGGPRVSYVILPNEVVHFSIGILVGAGGFTILSRNNMGHDYWTHDSRAFFAMEPQGEVEANLMRHLRVALGVSYRYIDTPSGSALRSSDLSGPAASLLFKGGVF
jgi:hypothetical protein